ncbi:MAG: iron-sulfur cluster assembly scaffold protein [Vicinamibacterales bacterium]|jgi:nitrogen fixation NifU-like protein
MGHSDEVLKRVREPQRVGTLPAGLDVGSGVSGTLEEGAVTRIDVRVSGTRVVEARFRVFGCSAAIASASLVAEWLEGASLDEAQALTAERVTETLQLAHEREHVARRAIEAARQALASATAEGGTT